MKSLILKTLLAGLIAAGVFGLTLLVFGEKLPLNTELPLTTKIPKFESLDNLPVIAAPKANITQIASEEIAQDIIAHNPDGPQTDETGQHITAPDVAKTAENLIQKSLENFDPNSLRPTIALENLVIINSSNRTLAENYFQGLNSITQKYFFSGQFIENEVDPELTGKLLLAYSGATSEVFRLSAPVDLAPLHRRYLVAMSAIKNALVVMNNGEQDALQAILASRAREEFLKELDAVMSDMDEYILQHDLSLSS